MSRLLSTTPKAWLHVVLADFDTFLTDHANCERKAAAMALSLVSRFPTQPILVDAMLGLAQEELAHFQQVYQLMRQRGLDLVPESKDPYVNQLRALIRHGRHQLLLDQLCVASVIESRGCERFGCLAAGLPPGPEQEFYAELTRAESRHGGLFARLAKQYHDPITVDARLAELFAAEAEIVAQLPHRAALH